MFLLQANLDVVYLAADRGIGSLAANKRHQSRSKQTADGATTHAASLVGSERSATHTWHAAARLAARNLEPRTRSASSHDQNRGVGAGDGIRTRDILLGKQTLCQLSYSRSGDPEV